MGTDKDKSPLKAATKLRRSAEERLRAKAIKLQPPQSVEEMQRLVYELNLHQIELEMQNTELRQVRGEVETSLKKYSDLFDFAPVGYFTLDRDGAINTVNLSGAGLLGVERSHLIGRRFGFFVADKDRLAFADFLEKVFTSPTKEVCDIALLREGYPPFFVQIEAVAEVSGQECRIALIDITDRKQTEEALRQAKESAEVTARTKSQFLANMSHELRTPMTGVLGMLDLVLLGNLEAEQREFINAAHSSARSLVLILNDILDMTKIEMGKFSIESKPFSLRKCVESTFSILFPAAKSKGLDLSLTVAANVPETLVGDQIRLNQILTNLAGNAVKFTEHGKVEICVEAGGNAPGGKREVIFTVTDTGIGIPDDKRDLLFRVFSQVDQSHSRSYGGTGLGLAISKEIVENMGGTINFRSEEEKGSTFTCTIPFVEGKEEHNAGFAPGKTVTTDDASRAEETNKARLLVAEDDHTIRQVLGTMLQMSGYETDLAENGQLVVEMWANGKYDLILMDVQMPLKNGFEATAAIREIERTRGGHIPIVAMTAHALKKDEEKCLDAGMDAYVSKPIDFNNTLQVIRETLKASGLQGHNCVQTAVMNSAPNHQDYLKDSED